MRTAIALNRARIATALLATAALALAYAGGGATRAAADCDESLVRCNPWQEVYPFPMENRVLAAHLELRETGKGKKGTKSAQARRKALAIYRRIVDQVGYDMPKSEPGVGIYMVRVAVPTEKTAPAQVTDYLEGNIGIKVSHDGEDGYYSIGMPVNDTGAESSGRRFGYPKYLADLELVEQGDARRMTAIVGDRKTMELDWTADAVAPVGEALSEVASFSEPFFQRAKAHEGPDYWRTKLTPLAPVPAEQASDQLFPDEAHVDGVTKLPDPEPGYVHVTLDGDLNTWEAGTPGKVLPDLLRRGETLADLIDIDQVVPGTYAHIEQQTLYYQNEKLNREPCAHPPIFDPLYGYLPPEMAEPAEEATGCSD